MVKDPIMDILEESIYKPFHDAAVATSRLLPKWKTIYTTSEKSTVIDINWQWDETMVRSSSRNGRLFESREIINPLQLSPRNGYIGLRRITEKQIETEQTFTLKGTWQSRMVGPLFGKPYEKVVPIRYSVVSMGFIYPDKSSSFKIDNYVDSISNTFKCLRYIKEKDYWLTQAILTATVKEELQKVGLPNINYFGSGFPNASSLLPTPVNYVPLHYNIDYFFASVYWAEYIFDPPLKSLQEKDPEMFEQIVEAQSAAQDWLRDWVYDATDKWFTYEDSEYEEDSGWSTVPGWRIALGTAIMNDWSYVQPSLGVWITRIIDATMGQKYMELEQWQKDTLIKNKDALDRFQSSGILPWLFAINICKDDYVVEWIFEILAEE